jgi:hypothetical protein
VDRPRCVRRLRRPDAGRDYWWPVEFRQPARPEILIPYLLLFFGSILLMGLSMYRVNRRLWLVTVATSVLMLASMGFAMSQGTA